MVRSKDNRDKNKGKTKSGMTSVEVELHPDAQRRFERAVDAAVESGPIHRKPKEKRHGIH